MKYNIRQKRDFLFDKHHPSLLSKVQQLFTTLECNTLIALVGPLSTNKSAENTIREGHFETDVRQNDVILILLALFGPWNRLPEKFHFYGAVLEIYLDYC